MNDDRLSIAVEGPCCAGKTTLGRGLTDLLSEIQIGYVQDYSDFVGGGRNLPPAVPDSLEAEEQALRELLRIEADRTAAPLAANPQLLLIDRSVYTLLAHCHALDRMTGVPYDELAHRILTGSKIPVWPDLIVYLDVSEETVAARNRGKFPPGSIFVDPAFNAGFRSYFRRLADAGLTRIVWLDAAGTPEELRDLAAAPVRRQLCGAG
jgi:thymidylate kinase